MFDMIGSYDEAWKAIISPPRQEYGLNDLGPAEFAIKNDRIRRTDFRLLNNRGHIIECSFFEHVNIETPVPCVVYLHGNGCSRIEALHYLDTVLSQPVSFFCFDFSGCGMSHGQYTSIGWHEQDDLDCILQYLYNCEKVSKIAVWGRSMGAITALFYANKDPRVKCFIFDSPFSSFKQMVKELVKQKAPVPEFVVTGALKMIRKTILKKANFDIDALKPSKFVDRLKIPALFGAARDDVLVSAQHTRDLFNTYGGVKDIMIFEGDHNSKRPIEWKIRVQNFIKTHLVDSGNDDIKRLRPFKQYFYSQYNPEESIITNRESQTSLHQDYQDSHYLSKPLTKQTSTSTQQGMRFSWLDQTASVPSQSLDLSSRLQETPEEKMNAYYLGQKSTADLSIDTTLNRTATSTQAKSFHSRKVATCSINLLKDSYESTNLAANNCCSPPDFSKVARNSNGTENRTTPSMQSVDSNVRLQSEDIVESPGRSPSFHKHSATLKDISSFGLNGQSDISTGASNWRDQSSIKGIKVFTPKPLVSDHVYSASPDVYKSSDFNRISVGNYSSQTSSAGLPTFHKKNLSNVTHSYGTQALRNEDYSSNIEDYSSAKVGGPCHKQKKKSMMLQVRLNLDTPIISTSSQTARTSMADFLARNLYQERNSATIVRESIDVMPKGGSPMKMKNQ